VSFLVKYFIIKKLTPTNTVRGVCANNKQTKSFSNIYRWHIANVDGDSDVDADPLFAPPSIKNPSIRQKPLPMAKI